MPAFRWLRCAMKAIEEGTEQQFLAEAPDEFNEEFFIP